MSGNHERSMPQQIRAVCEQHVKVQQQLGRGGYLLCQAFISLFLLHLEFECFYFHLFTQTNTELVKQSCVAANVSFQNQVIIVSIV